MFTKMRKLFSFSTDALEEFPICFYSRDKETKLRIIAGLISRLRELEFAIESPEVAGISEGHAITHILQFLRQIEKNG